MSKVCTNWTKATIDPHEAMMGLLSCLNSGKNAWIETRKNTENEMAFPIKKKNPELDNPFNWTMSFGTPRNTESLKNYQFFNETEKDMTYNWTACFGEEEAIEEYQKNGTITKEMFLGVGICHPVRIEDANYYQKEILGDNYNYSIWTIWWKPKNGIPCWVIDDSIKEVFVICYDDSPVDKKEAAQKAGQFLMNYASRMEEGE